jgi:triosephosphate isomerase
VTARLRRPVVAGNWKMHTTVAEARVLAAAVVERARGLDGLEVVVCPPFVSLEAVRQVTAGSNVQVGAQNMFHQPSGAYTGEISPLMLAPLCRYVILGHSERRTHFGETDEQVNLKVRAAVAYGLTPIMCVGENLAENEAGQTETVVERQVRRGLYGLAPEQIGALVIAYEPVWAIGTGRPATPQDANRVIGYIRRIVAGLAGESAAAAVRIQYGGSVTPQNAPELAAQPEIDGALVGGASLRAEDFGRILRAWYTSP